MSCLNKIERYPIDSLFVLSYYEKLLFTHPKKAQLLCLFITHLLLIISIYVAPIIYDNVYFNIYYVSLIIAMVCGWIVFNGECWINSLEKKILDPNYKDGDNLDVNPSIDLLTKFMLFPILNLFKKDNKKLINKKEYIYRKKLRYQIPLLVPLISIIIFTLVRLQHLPIQFRGGLIFGFIILLLVANLKWKSIDKDYI